MRQEPSSSHDCGSSHDFKDDAYPPTENSERRKSVRNMAVVSHALLGWKSARSFTTAGPCSATSASAAAWRSPRKCRRRTTPVVICLDGGMLSVWYESQSSKPARSASATWKLRLGFPESCPYPLYMAVAYGIVNKASDQQVELPRFQPETTTLRRKAPPDKSYRFWERG